MSTRFEYSRGGAAMKFFLDTADINEIREAAEWGLLDGVTTNPSLVAKTGLTFDQVLRDIVKVVSGPVSAEVTALDAPTMLDQAHQYADIAPNIVVKVPLIAEGLKAARQLTGAGTKNEGTQGA